MSWLDRAKQRNSTTTSSGRWRQVETLDGGGPTFKLPSGETVISFASNDYLGLSQHPKVKAAARDAIETWGAGSGSARLIVGARPPHEALEKELAAWKKKESAVLFPSGSAANLGVISALGTDDVLICSDELNHASIVDACRLARAQVAVYPHKDVDALDSLLSKAGKPSIVVTDSVFSMDGDLAPIEDITEICERHGALSILDEAHAVLGPEPARSSTVDRIRVGTLSKFLGSAGGFAACDREVADLLINESRPFIFTTAGTPADAAAALAALEVFRSEEGTALRQRLAGLVAKVRPGHPSPIIPFIIGDEAAAVAASRALREKGLLVPAIRPPSVAPGSSRLRVTLSAAHTDEQVEKLIDALAGLPLEVPDE